VGRVLNRGASRMDNFQLNRGLVAACLFVLFSLPLGVHAAGSASALIGGGAVKSSAGTWSVKGASATAANGAFITPATVTAAGRSVTMPATATIAANAAAFAVTAVRLNPTGLVLGLTAQWLLGEGLQWANNSWTKQSANVATYSVDGRASAATPYAACLLRTSAPVMSSNHSYCWNASQTVGWSVNAACPTGSATWAVAPATGASCTGTSARAAIESDFTEVASHPIPDGAVQELARADVPMPVNEPVLAQTPQVVDYGSPYVDPVTGKTVQTKTRITPDPTDADPYNVRIESYNVEVSPAPAPVEGEPVPVPKDEQPTDPCLDNPNRLGCMDAGSPEDVELETQAAPFSVNPLSIGGAGACPPDPVIATHGFSMVLKLGPICDAAGWLRPLVLALAWFSAALIVGGAVRES